MSIQARFMIYTMKNHFSTKKSICHEFVCCLRFKKKLFTCLLIDLIFNMTFEFDLQQILTNDLKNILIIENIF